MRCMLSDLPVNPAHAENTGALVVWQNGKIVGVICEEALLGIKTVRMTLTRASPELPYIPLQGQGIDFFKDEPED